MKTASSPFGQVEPMSQAGDSVWVVNDGSAENSYGTLNDSINTNDLDGERVFSNKFFETHDVEPENDDELDLLSVYSEFINNIKKNSTLLAFNVQDREVFKIAKNNGVNIILLEDKDRDYLDLKSFARKHSGPMFYRSNIKADGFVGSILTTTDEESEICVSNIYSNMRPKAQGLLVTKSSSDISDHLSKVGFLINKSYKANSSNIYLVEKNEISKVALVRHHNIADDSFSEIVCDIVDTDVEKAIGLQSYNSLSDRCGLLFKYNAERDLTFHMGSVKFPIDITFINSDGHIKKVFSNIRPGSLEYFYCPGSQYVLETAAGVIDKIGANIGDRLFLSEDLNDSILKNSRLIASNMGMKNFIIKKSNLKNSSISSFENYNLVKIGSGTEVASSLVLSRLKDIDKDVSVFNLNDLITDEKVSLYRKSHNYKDSNSLGLYSQSFYSTGDLIKVSFEKVLEKNFYKNINSKYALKASEITDLLLKTNRPILREVYSAFQSGAKIAFAYSSNLNYNLAKECLESAVSIAYGSTDLSGSDSFMIPSSYGSREVFIASQARYPDSGVKLFGNNIIKVSGIPVPDATKNSAKKAADYISSAKKLCNKLIENFNQNKSVYEKLSDKPTVVKNSKGEYQESCKRNARICKNILINVRNAIEVLKEIRDVSTTDDAINPLAECSKTFAGTAQELFRIQNIIDTDDFIQILSENTDKANAAIDDLKIIIDRCKEYIYKDIVGIMIISE